jgi:hypothetical protein
MFGVDPARPGPQEYYDSLFQLYAQWGVDFVKADDMLHPVYHRGEIEMIRKALDRCGRPMVLSVSPGKGPVRDGLAPPGERRHVAGLGRLLGRLG